MKSPFKFLDAFELKDKQVFFGREEETDALYNMVFKTPLLLVYGLSGTGKTSLIQCGLAGRFTGPNWFPFYIRRGDDINNAIRRAFKQVTSEEPAANENLKDIVSTFFRTYLRPVYLIFDQFEELFILGDRDEQQLFAQSIRALIDADLPCKVIFVMREEFIGQLYHIEKEIPAIYDFRLRVEPMGFKKVQSVISGSFEAFSIDLEMPVQNIERMYNSISAGKSGVQLPYLQVYLDMLWREDFSREYPHIEEQEEWVVCMDESVPSYPPLQLTTKEIESFGAIEDVLARFLREKEKKLSKELQSSFPKIPANTVRQILDAFVTEEGTKRPVRFTRTGKAILLEPRIAKLLSAIPEEVLAIALERLENARLLRERDDALELAHDSLAALIDQERTKEQRHLNELRNRLNNAFQEFQLNEGTAFPSKKLLMDVEEKLEVLQLAPELADFYKKSQKETLKREQAEQEEAKNKARSEEIARRAEEEARLRKIAERSRYRALILAVITFALALAAFIFATQARRANREAQESLQKAQKSEEVANQERSKANLAKQEALDSANVARIQRERATISEQMAKKAYAQLQIEQMAKERLQISAKTDIVESFLDAGYCMLAKKAMDDLKKIVMKASDTPEIQRAAAELQKRVEACKK